nr:14138_t:CDS:2 [Entrophospora candida]
MILAVAPVIFLHRISRAHKTLLFRIQVSGDKHETSNQYKHDLHSCVKNASHLVLLNSGSSPQDCAKIIGRYTDDVKNASMVINSYLQKNEFIVFDLTRSEDDPLAIRLREKSMCQYIAGSRTGKRSRAGERFFEDFNSHFWERPETPFDILHNTNTSTKRRRRNRTPPPSYEVSTILSTSRRESTTNQRNQSASPTQRATSERNENNSETATTNNNQDNRRNENTTETATTNNNQDNRRNENTSETVTTGNNQDNGNNVNNVNDVSENSGHNANDVDENLDNVRYLSSSELANITSSINISASQNDSDVSMFDVEDSQPPSYMESINEERNP